MNPLAIEQASRRLERAQNAADRLRSATNYRDQEEAWTDYLLATNGIYSKLEQGVKGNSVAEPWFGRQKHLRRKDPLLSYLHLARNADEHGITRVTEQIPGSTSLHIKPKYNERHPVYLFEVAEFGDHPAPGDPGIKAFMAGARVKCVRVIDERAKVLRDPPATHLGKPIELELDYHTGPQRYPASDYVDVIADTALPFFAALIEEARTFIR